MNIEFLFAYLSIGRLASAKRPWAHRTKKGPGRIETRNTVYEKA